MISRITFSFISAHERLDIHIHLRVILTLLVRMKPKNLSEGDLLTTNYCRGNRFHPSVQFNARLSGPGIINAPLSSDSENEIETSLCAVENPRFFKLARRLPRRFLDTAPNRGRRKWPNKKGSEPFERASDVRNLEQLITRGKRKD